MRRAVETMKRNNRKSTFILQLTAMVDMFTIMIVFLLKSYSTSAVHVTAHEGLKLPHSSSYTDPVEAVRLVVATDGIYVDDKKIVPMNEGHLEVNSTEANDPDFIKGLFQALDEQAKKAQAIAEQNTEFQFDGKIVMLADQGLDYGLLKKVMYTSSLAGYADMKLATMANQ